MKKKQLLATLVMLSLMQGSVYAADVVNWNNKEFNGASPNNEANGLLNIADGNKRVEYDSITITDSKNAISGNTGTVVSAIYVGYADHVKNNSVTEIKNFQVNHDYVTAGLGVDGLFIAVPNAPAWEASSFTSEKIIINNVDGYLYTNGSDKSKGSVSGIALTSGGRLYVTSEIVIYDIESITNKDAYGINSKSHSSKDRPAILNSGSVKIDTVTGNENAYGISFVGTESEITNGLTISNITALNGDAYGLKAEKHMTNDNNMITDLSVGDIAQITNIKATNGAAIGAEFDESNLAFSKNLSVSEVYGEESATGILVNGGSFSVKGLNISKIDSPNYVNGLVLNDVVSEKVTSAYINVYKDNVEGYAGHFLDEMVDDNNDDKADITRIALRANDGGTVDWQAGGYEIYGAIVAGKGDENAAGAGNITISGDNNKIYGDVFAGNGGNVEITLSGTD